MIEYEDYYYNYIKTDLIDVVFPLLNNKDKKILHHSMIDLINLIYIKFNLDISFWNKIISKNLRAILNLMLPYLINHHLLENLKDIYLKQDSNHNFIFSNSQYNRCVRYFDNNNIKVAFRPFLTEYFIDHFLLLLMSIDSISNKLYVNWVNVLPIPIDNYKSSLYDNTIKKFTKPPTLLYDYIDIEPGISYQDIYNVISNHLFEEIKNYKWLIYDISINNKPINYFSYLKQKINLNPIINNISWYQLTKTEQNNFNENWMKMINSSNQNDNIIINDFFFFFSKYHINKFKENIPINEIYLFLLDQIKVFKKTWYYYYIDNIIKKDNIYITPKNIYNYAKSLIHQTINKKFVRLPKYWCSLSIDDIKLFFIRLFESNDWFNINNYIKKIYPFSSPVDTNLLIKNSIQSYLIDIIFQSLIYHGLLSQIINSDKLTIPDNTNFFYYLTGEHYDNKYFDYLKTDQIWTYTYAMNWVSQINFFHHYINNRVIYITGSTGVGKSTQIPKLLMYSQKMIDYNQNGKIIVTQPRIPPTITNSETISKELGVPINVFNPIYNKNVPSNNYYVQYKYQRGDHTLNSSSFLKIVTDGTLFDEIKKYPFLTYAKPNVKSLPWEETFLSDNIYDIVIVDEAHEHNVNMDMILTLIRDSIYVNNTLKLVIISATMEDDEPRYRRYYRTLNDNRLYPLNKFIETNKLDRCNVDRRINISPPGQTTQFLIKDNYLSKFESDQINISNYLEYAIKKTVEVANSTTKGDILLFLTGQADIKKAVIEINKQTVPNIIALGYYSELDEESKNLILNIDKKLSSYTVSKTGGFVNKGTYTRAIIIATNVAEASITIKNLRYVIDSGYTKTVVYDPLENISKMLIVPISYSSSVQRRGRVGRVAPGTVYYLYDKEKIINNKTSYKIADTNIKDLIVGLMKKELKDSFIITDENDVNNLVNISNYENNLWDVILNPEPYIDIIKKQYFIDTFYNYYGHGSLEIYNHTRQYFINNFDDYGFQLTQNFISRAMTGYDNFILNDEKLKFYLVHPDENIINRDLFTGELISLKNSDLVPDSYYYYILKVNNININIKEKDAFKKIDYSKFKLMKYNLAINYAKLEFLVINLKIPDPNYLYIDYPNADKSKIKQFFLNSYQINQNITITTKLLSKLKSLQQITSSQYLNDTNNLLWYSYGIPYNLEILPLIIILNILPSFKNMDTFIKNNSNKNGDIYTIYKLWKKIKNEIKDIKTELNLYSYFEKNKNKYVNKEKMNYEQYIIFDYLFNHNELNNPDEYYYYIQKYNKKFDIDEKTQITEIDPLIIKKIKEEYLNNQFTINKKIWEYEYMNKENNIITWINTKLNFNHIFIPNTWNKILETYLRAYSINLIYNKYFYYLQMVSGITIKKDVNTTLTSNTEFMIYQNYDKELNYLTPIKIEWLIELNPYYYYYFFFDKTKSIYYIKNDKYVNETIDIINNNKNTYNIKYLIEFLDKIDDKELSNILRKIDKNK